MKISEIQMKAICHKTGPAMVIAGPGSGKTLVITQRVRHLVQEGTAAAGEILVITFTRSAAAQMRSRYERSGGNREDALFGTFHSVFFRILSAAYHYRSENILKEEEKMRILAGLAARAEDRILYSEASGGYTLLPDRREILSDLAAEISRVKNERFPLEHFYSSVLPEDTFRRIYAEYERQLYEQRKLDFDDILVFTLTLLKQRPDILTAWQKRFRFILIDEFQDVNALQFDIIRLLASLDHNLFIVGDDDQSIYRFRGARPEIMLNFTKQYPRSAVYVLNENFRSSREIIEASARVISQNRMRFEKEIRHTDREGEPVEIRCFSKPEAEGKYLAECILKSASKGTSFTDMAVLTRTNSGGRYLTELFMEYEIPFQIRGLMPDLYDHWITEDLFAYLRLAGGSMTRGDFLRIMNRPNRYLGRDCLIRETVVFQDLYDHYRERGWMIERIRLMEQQLKFLKGMKPYAAVNFIRYGIGYEDSLTEYARVRGVRQEEYTGILDELQERASGFKSLDEWMEHISRYRKEMESGRSSRKEPQQGVILTTMHGSKGLEFEEVFLPDLNEGIIPHPKTAGAADLEEERRLLYVGMTRAKRRLHMFWVKERYGRSLEPSRFLRPLISKHHSSCESSGSQ